MAQLKEDEWPTDGEPTTSEEEGDRFKHDEVTPTVKTRPEPSGGARKERDTAEAERPGD